MTESTGSGWSSEAVRSRPKEAALLAMAAEPMPSVPFVMLESGGVILICGRDEIAVEAGNLLKDHLDVTVLIEPPAPSRHREQTDFPVAKGKVRTPADISARSRSSVDDFAKADAVLARRVDVRAFPRQCAVAAAISSSTSPAAAPFSRPPICAMVICAPIPAIPPPCSGRFHGARSRRHFEKPRYIAYDDTLCAHSRSGSSAVPVAWISVRHQPSHPQATTWPSTPMSVQAAANALPPVRPVRHPTHCLRKMC